MKSAADAESAGEGRAAGSETGVHAAYDQAIELYDEHLRMHPDDSATRLQYARVLNWDTRYAAAQRQYVVLLRESPDRADLQ